MKKILFLTGTRADFGKLKSLISAVSELPDFEYAIFVTGMHTLSRYGNTYEEIYKAGFKNIYMYTNQFQGEPMDLVLANTINGLSRFMRENRPDMLVIHGDRVEALAGAIVGAFNNILVAHIEGGEVSGTIDESIRHAISKLAHVHFVANENAAKRLKQLGEHEDNIFVIGSPDIDIMLSPELPTLTAVRERYEIYFDEYAIVLYHPVTTDLENLPHEVNSMVEALLESGLNYVVIYPNNDQGCEYIFEAYKKFSAHPRFRVFPSLRFEYFLTLLKNARFIIGNSSAGVREAPVYGVPSINLGTRQNNRYRYQSILDVPEVDKNRILLSIDQALKMNRIEPSFSFGTGNSRERFISVLKDEKIWKIPKQKQFNDLLIGV